MATRESQFDVNIETSALPVTGQSLGNTFDNTPSEDLTIATGTTHWHPNLTIESGVDWTVDAGGKLLSACQIVVEGELTVNGEAVVIG